METSHSILFKQFNEINIPIKVKKFLVKSCEGFFETEFSEKHRMRDFHEGLTVNDCYTILRQKYEFIANYDLDEIIFPSRVFNNFEDFYEKNMTYNCSNHNNICQLRPFSKSDSKTDNLFYDYIQSLVAKNKKGRDVERLSSIYFEHVAYISPNNEEEKLMNELATIIKRFNKKKTRKPLSFPLKLYFSSPPYKRGHTFIVNEDDLDYLKYLHKVYSTFFSSTYNEYLKKSNKVDKNLVRYLYYITEPLERAPKAIHYYKNVNTIFSHRGLNFVIGHWNFSVSAAEIYNGNYLAHYRPDAYWLYKTNSSGPIKKLNFDHEYFYFLLRNFTNYCEGINESI